jgi:hypothetical protein
MTLSLLGASSFKGDAELVPSHRFGRVYPSVIPILHSFGSDAGRRPLSGLQAVVDARRPPGISLINPESPSTPNLGVFDFEPRVQPDAQLLWLAIIGFFGTDLGSH